MRVLRDCLQAQQTEDTTLLAGTTSCHFDEVHCHSTNFLSDVEAVIGLHNATRQEELIADFDLPDDGSTGDNALDEEIINADTSTTRYYSKRGHGVRMRTSIDEHNEVCEVCEKGGDLLCCDTCTLVFHLKCVRPRMNSIPKGEWSCSYCVLDVCSFVDFPFTLFLHSHSIGFSLWR